MTIIEVEHGRVGSRIAQIIIKGTNVIDFTAELNHPTCSVVKQAAFCHIASGGGLRGDTKRIYKSQRIELQVRTGAKRVGIVNTRAIIIAGHGVEVAGGRISAAGDRTNVGKCEIDVSATIVHVVADTNVIGVSCYKNNIDICQKGAGGVVVIGIGSRRAFVECIAVAS
jgi:hypothetical protein